MADQTSTPTTSPIGSTPIPGNYTSEKLFLKINESTFNAHKSDINNNGQIAFVDNGDNSFIYAQGVKVKNSNVSVDDIDLSNYPTSSEVDSKITNAINALDVNDSAVTGKYISQVKQENGKISVTRATLPSAPTISVNSAKNSVTVSGTKYTLSIDNNVLSFSPYAATALGNLSLSKIISTDKASTSTNQYIGTSYTISVGIDITSTEQTLTIPVTNTTGNKYKIAIKENIGNTYLRNDTAYSTTTNGNITQSISSAYIMGDVDTVTWTNKPVTWNASTPLEVNTTNERTFTVYLTEEGKSAISKSITQSNINSKCTITAKVPVLQSANNFTNITLTRDIVYGSVPTTFNLTTGSTESLLYIAIPTVISKTIKNASTPLGALQINKQSSTKQLTHNGCTTNYDIYISNAKIAPSTSVTITLG